MSQVAPPPTSVRSDELPYPAMHERARHVLLAGWARLVTSRPLATLCIALALAGAAVWLGFETVEFKADRSDLVSQSHEWNRRYAHYKEMYPHWDDLTLVIEGDANDPAIDALARHVASHLQSDPWIARADAGFDAGDAPRLYQLATEREFDWTLGRIGLARSTANADNANAALAMLLGASRENAQVDPAWLRRVIEPSLKVMSGDEAEFPLKALAAQEHWQPFRSTSGNLRYIFVQPEGKGAAASRSPDIVAWIRDEAAQVIAGAPSPPEAWGMTGIGVIEADETRQSMLDSTRASILALVLITLLMGLVFRGVVVPLLAAASLVVALGWSVGWLALSVGHLQILSVVFGVVLLGLGVDFAVHLVARLELLHREEDDLTIAMPRVFEGVGPGLITGAVTTAAAFAAIAFTDFTGAAELGIISAGGILLCLVCVLSVFPALLAIFGRWKKWIHPRAGGEGARFSIGVGFSGRRPALTLSLGLFCTIALGWLALSVRYDPNVLNLHPQGVESVEWEQRIVREDQSTAWAALLPVQPEDAAETVSRLRDLEELSDVGGMGMLFPDVAWDERMQSVSRVREADRARISLPEGPAGLRGQLTLIASGIRDIAPHLAGLADEIDAAVARSHEIPPERLQQAWASLNDSFLEQRDDLGSFADSLASDPPTPENVAQFLPEVLRTRWIGLDGSWLLRIQPRAGEKPVLHPDRLGPFVLGMRRAAPDIIGPPVQIYESSRLIRRAYIMAAIYALPAILLVLLIDFRSLVDSISAIVPVVAGFIAIFGLMAVFQVPLNFANMIVMPIILGIGVDAGVHVIHRWRADPFGHPPGLSGGTGRGITVTMLTTIIGFACMLIAEHRGIRSLGFVMVVGLSATLIACYTILPATLALRKRPATAANGGG